jgi:hypothetical protein
MKETANYLSEVKKKRERRRRIWRLSLIFSGVLGSVLLIGWFILDFSFFRFSELSVEVPSILSKEDFLAKIEPIVIGNSPLKKIFGFEHFFVWPKKIPGVLMGMAEIGNLEIEKDYLHRKLTVSAPIRETAGIWCDGEQVLPDSLIEDGEVLVPDSTCWLFDENGLIVKETFKTSGNLIRVIYDKTGRSLSLGTPVLPERFIANLFSILDLIKTLKLDYEKILIENLDREELIVETANADIFFSLRENAQNYLEPLKKIINSAEFKKIQYIDLRVQNRIFYQ